MNEGQVKRSLFSLRIFLTFFLLVSFLVTCSILLFLSLLRPELGIAWEQIDLRRTGVLTFLNVLFLSLLCAAADLVRRKITIERPVRRILEAARRLTQGDFSARIQPLHSFARTDEFDVIIQHFNQMAEELSGVETLRCDFIANVSHELKTPLAAVQNCAALLQDPDLPEEQRLEYAKTIAGAARKLTSLITNILKLNKLENQQIFPDRAEYDLSEQLRQCLLGFEEIWEQKQLEIEADLPEGVFLSGDAELLSLVWNNLLSNALKFTPSGGAISLRLEARPETVAVTVADTGCGMSPEVGRHIFEKFYQGDSSHTGQGNGLGLALVKRVVDIMGGEIRVESAPGKGSAFTVTLRRGGHGAV